MNLLIDFVPAVLFYAAYKIYDFYVATAVLIVACFAMLGLNWLRTRQIKKMPLFVALSALVFGGLTLWLHNPEFLKLKLSVIYAVFSIALMGSQLIGERVLIERIGETTIKLPEKIWRRINLAWALFFALCSALNLYIAQHYSDEVWVNFKLYGFSVLIFVFMLMHTPFLARYLSDEHTN